MNQYCPYNRNKHIEYPAHIHIENYVVFKFLFPIIP